MSTSRLLCSLLFLSVFACGKPSSPANETVPSSDVASSDVGSLTAIFPKGELGPAEHFTGNAYNTGLVPLDSTYKTVVGNVYFEPGARSNWHTHPAGQILLITDGAGYHQLEGEPIQRLKRGDVVRCPPNVKHWHGAAADIGMQQVYLLPNADSGVVNWLEPVTDKQYGEVESADPSYFP